MPVSDVADADAVAVAVAVEVEVRSGRRRRGWVEEVLEAGEGGRWERWVVVSSYLMARRAGEAILEEALRLCSGLLLLLLWW